MSLLMHLIDSGQLAGKKILAVDREEKKNNDRTWCFWEKQPGTFEPVVSHSWEQLLVRGADTGVTEMDILPFRYKMIRGIDFYRYCQEKIRACPNIEIRYGVVGAIDAGSITLNGMTVRAAWVFSSIAPARAPQRGRFRMLQHFFGREIETREPVFDPGKATLMDFRVSQSPGTAFVYVMPFSDTRALVEYTIFSAALLKEAEYAAALDTYTARYISTAGFDVKSTEFGIIPMTNERGPAAKEGLTWIGTAGGQTKPSSGYTFSFIQEQSARLVLDIVTHGEPQPEKISRRFHFYDSVLLNVLATGKLQGESVFSELFRKNKPGDILAFLGNQSSLKQDWRILSSLPLLPFARAGWEEFGHSKK